VAAEPDIGRLLIRCADRHGIVAAVSSLLRDQGANILSSAQHSTDPEGGTFFMRMEFVLPGFGRSPAGLTGAFAEVAERFGMDWQVTSAKQRKRMAVLVSREDHCLLDLLWRWRRGDLYADIPLVISNHRDLEPDVRAFGLPFLHVPVTRGAKEEAEAAMLEALAGRCDLVVLARYMQILSGGFLDRLGAPVINIHHSFLPAFAGAQPYRQAAERGVKIIGATAHYVIEELDAGPIIEQDVARVTHGHVPDELARVGADIERVVLARAVRWHLEDRVLVDGARTVVFA
jgi:formyltetrahydrofolate deformylase